MLKMRTIDIVIDIGFLAFLIICSVFDLKNKEIPFKIILPGTIFSAGVSVWKFCNGEIGIAGALCSLAPGIFMLLAGACTGEKVGYGDGLILLSSGLALGFNCCFLSLCISLALSSICALALLALHKVKKDDALPFIPFLVFGTGVSFFV